MRWDTPQRFIREARRIDKTDDMAGNMRGLDRFNDYLTSIQRRPHTKKLEKGAYAIGGVAIKTGVEWCRFAGSHATTPTQIHI